MTSPSIEKVIIINGPDSHIDLSALDARHVLHYSRRLLFFSCTTSAQHDAQLTALEKGLESLLKRCPILGGIVAAPNKDGNDPLARGIVPGPGIELNVKDLGTSMPSLAELAEDNFDSRYFKWEQLMPVPADLDNEMPYPAFKVQFSSIDGGTILTFAMSHTVSDGNGMDVLMLVLAEEVRNSNSSRNPVTNEYIGMDRGPIRDVKSDTTFNINEQPAYRWKTPAIPQSSHYFVASAPELPLVLRIPPAKLKRLKADATTPDAPPISTHDAVVALMWRSLLLIRSRRPDSKTDQPLKTRLFLPSDCRKQLDLPASYVGNAVYQLTAQLDIDNLLSPSGLKHAASALRAAITAATPERVRSYFNLINNDPIRACRLGYAWEALTDADLAIGTCLNSDIVLYGSDWGGAFGPVQRFRDISDNGDTAVMPRLPDGSVEVVVSVMSDEVALLKGEKCFGKYCVP